MGWSLIPLLIYVAGLIWTGVVIIDWCKEQRKPVHWLALIVTSLTWPLLVVKTAFEARH